MNSITELEKQILLLLKQSNRTLPESILALAHIIHCSATVLGLQPAIVFLNLKTISEGGFLPADDVRSILN